MQYKCASQIQAIYYGHDIGSKTLNGIRAMIEVGYHLCFRTTVTWNLFNSEYRLINDETGSLREKMKMLYKKWDDLESRMSR